MFSKAFFLRVLPRLCCGVKNIKPLQNITAKITVSFKQLQKFQKSKLLVKNLYPNSHPKKSINEYLLERNETYYSKLRRN